MKKRLTASSLFLFLFYCHSICFGQQDPALTPVIKRFSDKITQDIDADNIHGSISVAVLHNKSIIWSKAFGYASHEKDVPADTATIYRLGSITKSFTAVLLMQLVEEGKVKLDDPVENFVPEVRNLKGYDKAGKITLRQLASHTSGLQREPRLADASVGPVDHWEEKVMACIPRSSFAHQPATQFLYSNIGFAILGLAIERIAGIPYLQLIQQRILTPLHMDHTFFTLPDSLRPHLAEGIENDRNGASNLTTPLRELDGRGYRVPNGGLFSTSGDLAKFAAALEKSSPMLSDASLAMLQQVPPGGGHYGLGLILTKNDKVDIIGHNGSVAGYTSRYAIEQESGFAVILLRNYNIGQTNLDLTALELLEQLKKASEK